MLTRSRRSTRSPSVSGRNMSPKSNPSATQQNRGSASKSQSKTTSKTRDRSVSSKKVPQKKSATTKSIAARDISTSPVVAATKSKAPISPSGKLSTIEKSKQSFISNKINFASNNICSCFSILNLFSNVNKSGLRELKKYTYKPDTPSFLDRLLDPFWERIASHVPLFISPNIITVLGMKILLSVTLYVFKVSPFLDSPLTLNVRLLCLFGLFFQQTFDAVDGKHARRTGVTSQLGQLMDHGCDLVSLICCCVLTAASLQLGIGRAIALLTCLLQTYQLLAIYYQRHFGIFKTQRMLFGVTEGQILLMIALPFLHFIGEDVLNSRVLSLYPSIPFIKYDLQVKNAVLYVPIIYFSIFLVIFSIQSLVKASDKRKAFFDLAQLYAFMYIQYCFMMNKIFAMNPLSGFMICGAAYFIVAFHYLISSMCRMKFIIIRISTLVYALSVVAFHFDSAIFSPYIRRILEIEIPTYKLQSWLPSSLVQIPLVLYYSDLLAIYLVWTFSLTASVTIEQVRKHLDIPLFAMPQRTSLAMRSRR